MLKWLATLHSRALAAWAVLAFSLLLTAIAWYISQSAIQDKVQTRFELQSQEIVSAINSRLKAYEMGIYSGKSFFDSSENVTREEWASFVQGIQIDRNFPGIQGLGYSEMIPASELDAHEKEIRDQGFADYKVRPEGVRDLYSSIVYLEPFDWRNRRAFGYDMYSQETRREAMNRAMETGQSAISGRVTLVQETNVDKQYGFLMYVPLYKVSSQLLTRQERREMIRGFVYSPFRADDFMRGILGVNQKGLVIELYDGDHASEESLLYRSTKSFFERFEDLESDHLLPNVARTWSLRVIATPEFAAQENLAQPMIIGVSGLVIDVLLFLIVLSMGRKERLLQEQKTALEHAKKEAEQANVAKSSFLAAMSHEIRTPLNGIVGMLEVLNQSSLKGDQIEMVRTIGDSSDNLLKIISDILDFSKIEAGKLEIHNEPLKINELVDKTCQILDRLAIKNRVEFSLYVDPNIPHILDGDGLRLSQVLTNLINNAIKFSAKHKEHIGKVRLEVRLESEAKFNEKLWLRFIVIDNGIGMSSEQVERIFQPFEQADSTTTRRFGGTGLGLSISRQLVAMMGGEIWVQSRENEGSEFTLRLPFSVLEEKPQVGDELSDALTALRQQRYLLIGRSNEGLMNDLKDYLKHDQIVFEQADSLLHALSLQKAPSIWIMEVPDKVPVIAELELQLKPRPDVKLLLLTHLVKGHNRRRHARYMSDQVMMSDDNVLTRRRFYHLLCMITNSECALAQDLTPEQRSAPSQHLTRKEAIERQELILVVEDNEVNQQVLRRQLLLLGRVADFVENGADGIDAWHSGLYSLILSDIHMPVMDGLEMTQRIRQQEAEQGLKPIPVIAISANAIKGEARRCLQLGMNDYLVKPATLNEIQHALDQWLPVVKNGLAHKPVIIDNSRSSQVSTEPSDTSQQSSYQDMDLHLSMAEMSRLDLEITRQLVGDDSAVINAILLDFQHSAKQTVIQLNEILAQDKVEELAAIAHRFKSSAATVGAMKLQHLCVELQKESEENQVEKCRTLIKVIQQEVDELFNEILSIS